MESPSRLLKIIFSGILCAIIAFSFLYVVHFVHSENRDTAEELYTVRQNIERFLHIKTTFLTDIIPPALSGAKGNYAVVVESLDSDDSYALNDHTVYDAASLYKLWVMATAYQQIQAGKLDPNETLEDSVDDLNKKFNIASDEAELTEGTVSFTVHEALAQMITISHNYAALILTQRLGGNTINAFLKDNGLKESTLDTDGFPKTTAADIALFYEKLYHGEFANEKYTNEMISLLVSQQRNNKLPKYLPTDTVIAHKTGEINDVTHDAGIVFLPDVKYIIVVLSKSDYPPGAEDRISSISRAVYDYFADGS